MNNLPSHNDNVLIKHSRDTGVVVSFQTGSTGEWAVLVKLDPDASEPGISRFYMLDDLEVIPAAA
jgi:hypothetical protein